jgi:hypothetical protein
MVGAAVREADQRHVTRSHEADGDPLAHRGGQGGQYTDHLSGGPHHRHRQPDEGLRRRCHDRGQGERRDRAGADRRPGADAVQPAVQEPGAPALVPEGEGHHSRAGEAHRRSRAQGPQAPAGRGRGALWHHVQPGVPYHLDRPHGDRSGDRSRRPARPQPRRGRGPAERRAQLQAPACRRRHSRRQADADGGGGPRARRHASECQCRRRHRACHDDGGPRAGHDQLHRRRGQYPRRLQGSADRHHHLLTRLHREGPARQPGRRHRERGEDRLS